MKKEYEEKLREIEEIQSQQQTQGSVALVFKIFLKKEVEKILYHHQKCGEKYNGNFVY